LSKIVVAACLPSRLRTAHLSARPSQCTGQLSDINILQLATM